MPVKFMKRFLDDIILLYCGSIESLHNFFEDINSIHPHIKFTMSHTTLRSEDNHQTSCACPPLQAIPFLDISCTIKEGGIITDLYRKPTDKVQYLLTSSCHPAECLNSIPFALSMRINRACSEEQDREQRFQELKDMLLSREYSPGIIEAAIAKARAIPRPKALRRVTRQDSSTRPVFVVQFDPLLSLLPSIPNLTRKHLRSMVGQCNYLQSVFPEPPLVAFERQNKNQGINCKSQG